MKSIHRFVYTAIPCVLVLFALSGCDRGKVPGLVKYEGTVTYNGEPLAEAMLSFSPTSGGRTAYAMTNAEGQFKVTTIDPDDGIVKGQYKVSASKYVVVGTIKHPEWGEEAISKNKLPAKYSAAETPFTIDVTSKKFDVLFELTD